MMVEDVKTSFLSQFCQTLFMGPKLVLPFQLN